MNALEKRAAKKMLAGKLMGALKKYWGNLSGKRVDKLEGLLADAQSLSPIRRLPARKALRNTPLAALEKARKSRKATRVATGAAAGGFVGLAGLGALMSGKKDK